MAELSTYVARKLTNDPNSKDCINFGTIPNDILMAYTNFAKQLKEKNTEIEGHETMAIKAFEKFKKCRSETTNFSMKKAKNLKIELHYMFRDSM